MYYNNEEGYVDEEDEEEMPMAERELADDAQWKVIQKNTFTRWACEHLKQANKSLTDLQNDLSDGLRLAALVEVLAGHQFKRINKRPNFRTQKLENVTMTLKFLEEEEGIRLVNIDSTDIVDCKLKLILGLIWTLILHYSISMPMWEGEEELPQDESGKGPTPKQRLLAWINNKMPDKPIKNFTTDWNDGTAIGALVDACAPGLCPDWETWNPKAKLANCTEAMDAAEQWLEVPQLIRPEEMIQPQVDEKAMMTYLSQYPNSHLKPGAPLRPKTNPARVRAYGPGLEQAGNTVGAPARFTVETFSAGRGQVEVIVINPRGQKEPSEIVFNNDRNLTYSCSYTPTMEGEYRVIVKFTGVEVPRSPFKVIVEGAAGDPTKVTASGPGIEPTGNMVGKRTFFNIFTAGAGAGSVDCVILDPHGRRDTTKPLITKQAEDNFLVEYTPKDEGLHSINVFFAGQQIPGSPFGVDVAQICNPGLAYATGRGIQPRGVRVRDSADFQVHTEDAGDGELRVQVTGPGGTPEQCRVNQIGPKLYECVYVPQRPGPYQVSILYGDGHIQRSPFPVDVAPFKESNIRAFGPGLEGGVVKKPAIFTVETNGETGALGFSIEGPSEAQIDCKDNGDGSAEVTYYPTEPGEYAVHVLCSDEDIPHSPYMAQIRPDLGDFNASQVRVFGLGVQPTGNLVGKATEFTIDTRSAGKAPLKVECFDSVGELVPVQVKDNRNGTFTASYVPHSPKKHTIVVSYGLVSVPGSAFIVHVAEISNPMAVKCFGPGIEPGNERNKPTYFSVDCRQAGPGDVGVRVLDERGQDVPIQLRENTDACYRIDYTPRSSGTFQVQVLFTGQPVPASPFFVDVAPDVDVSRVQVLGLEPSVYKESFAKFVVDAKLLPDLTGRGQVKAIVTNPLGSKTACVVDSNKDGTWNCSYSPFDEGLHQIEVAYEGLQIPGSPFPVNVIAGCDPSRVRTYGPGLQGGITNEPQPFTVELNGAGQGGLSLAIEGPVEAKMSCVDNKDGSCTVEYLPTKAGVYDIYVKFKDVDVPGSPFTVNITDRVDPTKVKAYGPGLEPKGARVSKPAHFVVDASNAGNAPLIVNSVNKHGEARPAQVAQKLGQPGIYDVTYVPDVEGPCKIDVTYGNQHIPRSPFSQHVLPRCEPAKVRVDGEGVRPTGVSASLPTKFNIDSRDAGDADLEVTIRDPEGRPVQPRLDPHGDGTYTCEYTPQDVGRYIVSVKYGGQELPESPYYVKTSPVGNADRCRLEEGLEDVVPVNQECVVTVNTSEAGKGAITCRIRAPNDGEMDVDIEDNGDGTVSIFYTPRIIGIENIEIKFGGQLIPNGKKDQMVASQIQSQPLQSSSVAPNMYHPIDFKLPVGPVFANVDAQVRTPSGQVHRPELIDNRNNTVGVKYRPTERGTHELDVTYNTRPIAGSPFKFHVDTAGSGHVSAFGPGLSHGISGEPAEFTVVTKDAGAGGLALAIEGPSKAEINCQDNKDGTCSVNYVPLAPGDYNVIVKFMDRHIPGSPFTAKVIGEPRKRAQVSVGQTSEVPLNISEMDIGSLMASIKSPSGREESCILKRMPNGNLGISFTPKEVGEHLVNVYRAGIHIPNSPFKINVGDADIGNAGRVKVYGRGVEEGMSNELNHFTVDTRNAGYGGLSLSIEGPSKADIECHDNHDGTCLVTYKPTEPGTYIVNVKYADKHVPGSPFTVQIGGSPTQRLMERFTTKQNAADVTHVGSQCELSLKIPGTNPYDMSATVTSPSGVTELCEIVDLNDSNYSIKFIPKEMGVHTVAVKHRDLHIPGSPFQFTVGPITEGGAHKVRASGPGLERAICNQANDFQIYTREAGAGGLSIAIEGPSKAEIDFQDRKDGSCEVSYRVAEPGEYLISVKFNDEHIADSPFRVYVAPNAFDGMGKKMSVAALQDKGLQIGRPAAFTVNYNCPDGPLSALVQAPSGSEDHAVVQALEADQFAVRFIPRENGAHLIHVNSGSNQPIPGSPFRILVGKYDADPGMVHATGDGLVRGTVDKKNRFFVNTVNAGSGALSVTVDGPSKVQLNCHESEDGYEFTYVPTTPGEYLITIKYGGNFHIVGSPFRALISGPSNGARIDPMDEQSALVVETVHKNKIGNMRSDRAIYPERVHCQGIGLKRAFIGKVNSFNVNTNGAGNDVLFVGVMGPEHAVDEVTVKHIGRDQYQVMYSVCERGTHYLLVKWGDTHVPGSPFVVDVP